MIAYRRITKEVNKVSGLYISVDPGQNESGYIVIENTLGKIRIREHGVIDNDALFFLFLKYADDKPVVIIEMIGSVWSRIGESTISTIFWVGRLFQAAKSHGFEVVLLNRSSVKKILCPKRKVNDSVIRAELIKMFGEPGTKKNPGKLYGIKSHVWQALGLLIAHLLKEGIYKREDLSIE